VTARNVDSVGSFARGQALHEDEFVLQAGIQQTTRTFPSTKSLRLHHFIQDRKNIGKVLSTL
jgi:hypothetical protein